MNFTKYSMLIILLLSTTLFSRSMEFNSCKTYVKVEKNLEKGEEFGLLAMEKEPNNSYIPYYIGRFIYRPQKRINEAGEMFLKALELEDTKLERSFRIGSGKNQVFIKTVHDAISLYGTDWFNYGVEAEQNGENIKAIDFLETASIFDKNLKGQCFSTIALIHYNLDNLEDAFKFIDDAINLAQSSKEEIEFKMMKIMFLRNQKNIDSAFEVYNSLDSNKLSLSQKYNLFLLHMDNDDCESAINYGKDLFLQLEEDISSPMNLLSEFSFNLAACYNHKADVKYNEIIDYMGDSSRHSENLTEEYINLCDDIKSLYSEAKDFFRLSGDYDESSNPSTKEYKRKMRKNIRKVDDTIIPALLEL